MLALLKMQKRYVDKLKVVDGIDPESVDNIACHHEYLYLSSEFCNCKLHKYLNRMVYVHL